MKRHSMFEDVPPGLQFYKTGDVLDDQGVWVPVPVYWILHGWPLVTRAQVKRRHGSASPNKTVTAQ